MTCQRLVDDWQKAHRFLTVQLAAMLGLLSAAYDYLPAVQAYFPKGWVSAVAVAIIVARIWKQAALHEGDQK